MIDVCWYKLTRLQEENNVLVGKHAKRSQEMQDEAIDLPNTVEVSVSQLLVLYCARIRAVADLLFHIRLELDLTEFVSVNPAGFVTLLKHHNTELKHYTQRLWLAAHISHKQLNCYLVESSFTFSCL